MAHGFGPREAMHRAASGQRRQEFIPDGRRGGHDNNFVHPSVQALPNVACHIGLACLDLKGSPLAISFGHKVDGLAAAHRILFGHGIAAGPQVVRKTRPPVPMFRSSQPVRIRFVDAQRLFPGAGQHKYFDS